MSKKLLFAASFAAIINISPAFAATDAELEALRAELQAVKQIYEGKIESLENRLSEMEALQARQAANMSPPAAQAANQPDNLAPASETRRISDNSFNPSIGVVLNGRYESFSENESELSGFAIGEESERGEEGLTIDETELNFSASVDDKFRGSATVALIEEGGSIEVEIEEAYVETMALPQGLSAKAGRFFSDIGYLNSRHSHSDDFSDRPLPNRAFLDGNYNDDGIQVSWILPTDLYTEIGGSMLQGDDFPAGGGDGSDFGAWTVYGRIGGDLGYNTAWRVGLSSLQASGIERDGNEDTVSFDGDSDLYILDARTTWAPTGNSREKEVIFQGEYFYRDEDGAYNDTGAGTGDVSYDDHQSGWYAQGVYKFQPQWRVGARFSQLYAGDVPAGLVGSALDNGGHDPWSVTGMVDWTNSEFSRLRLQYSQENLSDNQEDSQIILQYIMSIGAHGAHPF